LVRGFAIDLDKPGLAMHAAILQGGRIIAVDRPRRQRAAVAAALSRPDLAKVRFGFVFALPENVTCAGGPLEVRVAFDDGRVVSPDVGAAVKLCD
jgi:hypothetical protein